ncbi:MAG: hypothetical protein IPM39_02840 [Chloroflexi bacterium]|nr:hypothetical protein [Chloroflexota bacterium]
MKQRWWVWLCCLGLGVWLIGCAAAEATPTPLPCDDAGQTAVTLTLLDDKNRPLDRVQVSYRVNGGPWQELPERVNGRAQIPGGGGGYDIRAAKPGYETGQAAVIVPAAIPTTCQVTSQRVSLQLATAVCPTTPDPLTVQVIEPTGVQKLVLTAVMPGGQRQTLACQPDEGGCQRFTLPLNAPGAYQLVLDGLPSLGALSVTDGVIGYAWQPYVVELGYGQQMRRLAGEAANRLNLALNVESDEVGCPLPDLRGLTAVISPDLTTGEPYPPVSVNHQGGLTMTDLGAAECRARPVRTPVDFAITVPAGTPLADVALLYWLDGEWQSGVCQVTDGRLLCTAEYPNPLLAQPYAVKGVVGGKEYVATQLPFDTLCILFRP